MIRPERGIKMSKGSETKKINILIFPAGAENRMDIYDSLRHNPLFNVYGASSKADHAKSIYPKENYFIGDLNITEEGFFEVFNSLLKRFQIDFVIPTHDRIAVFLMKEEKRFCARILCSPYETTKIAENKKLTASALKDSGFYPKVYENPDEIDGYPVFLKPYIGAGSRGTHLVHDEERLKYILKREKDLLISEYLPGREYTVGCFTDRNRKLLFAGPVIRENIANGRSFHQTKTDRIEEFNEIATALNEIFHFRGSWFYQAKEDKDGSLKLLEFSVRQIGEMGLHRQMGVNFAAMMVLDAMGADVKILLNDFDVTADVSYKSIYSFPYQFNRVYIDLKDTLIINGRLNIDLLSFIYRCADKGIDVILLTETVDDYEKMLKNYSVSEKLFTGIISGYEDKIVLDTISRDESIYISSSFNNRSLVKERYDIPVFDLDAVECLP